MVSQVSASDDEYWMRRALKQAGLAAQAGEVPVGAVIVCRDECIAEAFNQPIASCDASAHAEIMALRQACQHQHNYRLPGSTLYVTIEPCTMCFGAMLHARIARLVYAAPEPRAGVVESQLQLPKERFYNHSIACSGGVLATESAALMQAFFRSRR